MCLFNQTPYVQKLNKFRLTLIVLCSVFLLLSSRLRQLHAIFLPSQIVLDILWTPTVFRHHGNSIDTFELQELLEDGHGQTEAANLFRFL